jgi:hypothetical protein
MDHTEFFDENFTEARIGDERWALEYQKDGAWIDAGLSNTALSYQIVSENLLEQGGKNKMRAKGWIK